MKKAVSFRWLLGCLLVLVAATNAAAGAPQQGQTREFDPELLKTGDLIRYRDLGRDDFLAQDPPKEAVALHGGELGAATCVFLTTGPEMVLRASSRGLDLQRGQVRATVEGLNFLTFMDRECSWWNPRPVALPDSYILQHEQIHFALFEIASRQMNQRSEELAGQLETVANDQQRALQEVHRQLDAEMQRVLNEVMARSNDFDRETSRTYRQDRQDFWWRSVSTELERLADVPSNGD